jgi:hypothetical protein
MLDIETKRLPVASFGHGIQTAWLFRIEGSGT